MNGVISKVNVGRIAERIVANELEYRGFRVTDLNKEGISANADLLAAKDGAALQIQVKGASWEAGWWFNYGACSQDKINGKGKMFNTASSFYCADFVVLVCVKTVTDYRCVVLPIEAAEQVVDLNLDHAFRTKRIDGGDKKPFRAWASLDYIPPRIRDISRIPKMQQEQQILNDYLCKWELLDAALASLIAAQLGSA